MPEEAQRKLHLQKKMAPFICEFWALMIAATLTGNKDNTKSVTVKIDELLHPS
ncbi:MAG: hypothetical protein JW815_02130 [Candidatus Bathyarchaeota archaeon]|nr:hypothetical protein [Candidatus Bathyarchaeum sp.]